MELKHRHLLESVANNLLKYNNQALPLICYALDPRILSNDEYEELKNVDLQEIEWYRYLNSGVPEYFLGALLLFIRNFYERGDGKDIWKSTPSLSTAKAKEGFTNCIRNLFVCRQWRNNLFPRDGTDIGLDWVRSQCWVIKAETGGKTSEVLDNNTELYKSLVVNFGSFPMRVQPANIDDWKLPDKLKNCSYIVYLFETHKWPLIQSLYAIAADGKAPDVLPNGLNWLKPLWGLKRNAIRENPKEKHQNAERVKAKALNVEWVLVYNDAAACPYYPALILTDCAEGKKEIIQENRSYSLISNIIPISVLKNKGFDINGKVEIKNGEETLEISLSEFFEREYNVFRKKKSIFHNNGLETFSLISGDNAGVFSQGLFILHRCPTIAEVKYGDYLCQPVTSASYIPKLDLYCSEYLLKSQNENTSLFCIGDNLLFEMNNPVGCSMDIDNDVEALYDNKQYRVVIGNSFSISTAVSMMIDPVDGITMRQVDNTWILSVQDNSYFKPFIFRGRFPRETREVRVVFVHENFFDNQEKKGNIDLSEGNDGKWLIRYENIIFRGKIESPVWCWAGDIYQKINHDENKKLHFFGPSGDVILRVDECADAVQVPMVHCVDKTAKQLLKEFFNRKLVPGRRYTLKIGGIDAYSGMHNPENNQLYEIGNNVYVYSSSRQGAIHIRHELFYRYWGTADSSQWEKTYTLAELLSENENTAKLPPGYCRFGSPGNVIIALHDAPNEFVEIVENGSIQDRWGYTNEIWLQCKHLMHLDDFAPELAIPKTTKLYSEIEQVSAQNKQLSFVDLEEMVAAAMRNNLVKVDSSLRRSGDVFPSCCINRKCAYYNNWGNYCEKARYNIPMDECAEVITYGSRNMDELRITRLINESSRWLSEVPTSSITQNMKRALAPLWRIIGRQQNKLMQSVVQCADNQNLTCLKIYLFVSILLCSEIRNEAANVWLPLISQYPDPLSKFVLLVRYIKSANI